MATEFMKLPTHCRSFEDLQSKVSRNINLTWDDVNKCDVIATDMMQECKGTLKGRNLLNLAIENLNWNNIEKLSNIIHPNVCPYNCYRSLFDKSGVTDPSLAKMITRHLLKLHTNIPYTDEVLILMKANEVFEEAVGLIEAEIKEIKKLIKK